MNRSLRQKKFLCNKCKQPRPAEEFEQIILEGEGELELFDPTGCSACSGLGFRGRSLVMEILMMNEHLDELIAREVTIQEFRKHARESSFRTMSQDGLRLVLDGSTTIEELSRVVDLTAGLS